MNIRQHIDKYIEFDVGEFSSLNVIIHIFIVIGLYETVTVFPTFLGVAIYMTIVGFVILITQFRKMRRQEKTRTELSHQKIR